MSFEWWSWSSYFLGVITALLPSALAFAWFAWRAPVIDDTSRLVPDDDAKTKEAKKVTLRGIF